MADDVPTARARSRRASGRLIRSACPAPQVPQVSYQVSVYVDQRGERCLVHTEDCRDEPTARNFAVNMLLATYVELGFSNPALTRQIVWCELEPGRWVGGQWQPDPRAEGEVDLASLDSQSGEITIEPWASLWRWPPAAGGAR